MDTGEEKKSEVKIVGDYFQHKKKKKKKKPEFRLKPEVAHPWGMSTTVNRVCSRISSSNFLHSHKIYYPRKHSQADNKSSSLQ